MIITTSYEPSQMAVDFSKQLSVELQSKWVPRNNNSIRKLKEKHNMNGLWIVSNDMDIKYYHEVDQPALFFHPSTALIRIKRLLRGEKDTLMECSGVSKGDSILDCTAGMASDSIVYSLVSGPSGKIIALESEIILYTLLKHGLKGYDSDLPPLNDAMKHIEIFHADHLAYLKDSQDKSMDIVYFDPMFRNPLEDSSALTPLRTVANPQPLTLESIKEAARVARKTVVLKEHRDSHEFARLGFNQVFITTSKIAYGVIEL